MSTRAGDGAGSSIERLLSGLTGPELVEDPGQEAAYGAGQQPSSGIDASQLGPERDRYDEDYEYYWGGVRIPLWMALIWQVPWRQRLDIFVIGFIVGMVVAGMALFWGFVLSQY
ncbi:MAG: hypothetical protein QOI73_3346 [Solirubrobacteraceae bacterium]|jgi:hypothetical protein|nr:hypothetical protein [Solirubrobacteraceae bacterium]